MCSWCKYIHDYDNTALTCDAFPELIPADILFEGFDHTKPHAGDNGIMFEKSSKPVKVTIEKVPASAVSPKSRITVKYNGNK